MAAAQDVAHCCGIEHLAQLQQLLMKLVVAHARVLASEADNQRLDFPLHSRSPANVPRFECPFAADEVPMPFQQGVWLDEKHCLTQPITKSLRAMFWLGGERDEHQFFRTRQAWLRPGLAFENAQLLTERANLEVFFVRRDAPRRQHIGHEGGKAQQELVDHTFGMSMHPGTDVA
jgi:hypothetical protein